MLEKGKYTANQIEIQGILNEESILSAIERVDNDLLNRILITDGSCRVLYDSAAKNNHNSMFAFYPEIIHALKGNDVFSWNYGESAMISRAAIPVYFYGKLSGCVYMTEYDTEQGALIASLQSNIFTITVVLELAIIFFALIFATVYTRRLRKIMNSIRTVRTGDYSHKIEMTGQDELSVLSDEFNDLIQRLQQSESKRRQFVSDASHELKTPLASIKLLTDSILQNQMDEQTVHEFVQDIGNEADRLNRMSHKLLSLAKIEDQHNTECEIVYIVPTIDRVARMLSTIARERNIRISTEVIEDSTILVQEDDLYQILFNLVENGIKYNKIDGHLLIRVFRQEDNAIVQVKDTGVGIPSDALENIFERFYRVDKARSRSTGGSGLGLSIVKTMVERNKGTITVESVVDVGTSFTLSFPIFNFEEDDHEV